MGNLDRTLRNGTNEIPNLGRRLRAVVRVPDLVARAHGLAMIASLVAVVVFWEAYALVINNALLVPYPQDVARKLFVLLTSNSDFGLASNSLTSLLRIFVGWGSGVGAGIVVGAAMASNRWIRMAMDPLIELGRPIPPLAFAPLLIVWFGIGELPKDLILFFSAFPVVAIATVSSFLGVDETWRQAAQTLGASPMYILRRITIRAALPGILTGMRIASGTSWGSLVAAEIIASTQGLGWMILQAGRYLDTDTIFVGIIVIGGLAFSMDRLIRIAESRLVPWRGKA